MKNEKHPIDELFQRGLNQHAVPPPMHVWERIEDNRSPRHRGKLVFLRQKFTIVSSAAAVLLLGTWLAWSDTPALGSFPLLEEARIVADKEEVIKKSLTLPTQQAGFSGMVESTSRQQKAQEKAIVTAEPALKQLAINAATTIKGGADLPDYEPVATKVPTESESVLNTTPEAVQPAALVSTPTLITENIKDIPRGHAALDVKPLLIPETGCARFSEGRPAIFLAVTAGPNLFNSSFSSRSNEFLGFANQRSSTESPRLSYGANARLSIVFPWGGAIRSGIGYTQLNEQMVFRDTKVRQKTITEIYGPNGNLIGTDTVYQVIDTVLRYNNIQRMIDIPFQLGYEVRYNKLTLAANAGVNINVNYSAKGNYLSSEDQLPIPFDNDDTSLEPVYKTKIGLSWQASLGVHYQLNDRLDLMAEPFLRYYPESFTANSYPLNHKYLVGGVGLGLRVLL